MVYYISFDNNMTRKCPTKKPNICIIDRLAR